jgi:hypothetical protein
MPKKFVSFIAEISDLKFEISEWLAQKRYRRR